MIEARWGTGPGPWSVGVEEEIMLVDAETFDLVPAAQELIRESEALELPGRLKSELFASVVELNTHECGSAADAHRALAELRRAAAALAESRGLRIVAVGTHPLARPDEQPIADEERYRDFVAYAGVSARRQGANGLHVHVGMPNAEACFQVLEGVLPWLPLVLALSANSPYLAGEATGLASNRAEVLAQLPRSGAPPAFASYGDWEAFVEQLVRLGVVEDYTRIWWDVRPHPRFGTLEIRMPDQPTAFELSAAFAALLQALCVTVFDAPPARHDPGARGFYQENRWTALRFGPAGRLIHPNGETTAPVPELARELIALVGPAAAERGSEGLLNALDPDSCEGNRQLEIGEASGLHAVCADLADRTVRSS